MIKHQWDEVALPETLKEDFEKKFICSRGDCKCERLLGKSGFFQYTRSGQFYGTMPSCYGDVPLNRQTIND